MNPQELFLKERRTYFIRANGGLSLPFAGFLYWTALGLAGFALAPTLWARIALFSSGLIFPLGLAFAKLFKSDLLIKDSPLSSLFFPALMAMFLSLPLTMVAGLTEISLLPLGLSIGMSLHWPVIGWIYHNKTCLVHAIVRTIGCIALWYALPQGRFTLLPLFVALVYLLSVFALRLEVKVARRGQA